MKVGYYDFESFLCLAKMKWAVCGIGDQRLKATLLKRNCDLSRKWGPFWMVGESWNLPLFFNDFYVLSYAVCQAERNLFFGWFIVQNLQKVQIRCKKFDYYTTQFPRRSCVEFYCYHSIFYLASQYRKSVSLFPLSCKVRFYGAGINYFYEPVEPHRV